MYKWDPIRALELIEKHKVSSFSGVPTMSEDILRATIENPDIDVSSLAMLNGGGAARPGGGGEEDLRPLGPSI